MIDLQPYRDAMERATSDEELKKIYDDLAIASRPIFYRTDKMHDDSLLPIRNAIVDLNRELSRRYKKEWQVGDRVSSRYFESGTVYNLERDGFGKENGYIRIKEDDTGDSSLLVESIDLEPYAEEQLQLFAFE